jgi:hypothetical protein
MAHERYSLRDVYASDFGTFRWWCPDCGLVLDCATPASIMRAVWTHCFTHIELPYGTIVVPTPKASWEKEMLNAFACFGELP